jgi:lipopolysaccharide exporter
MFNSLKSTEGTLTDKVLRSGFWVFLLRIINRGFSLLRLLILARLLSPNDFGLMGIALLTMSILETFSETGFQQALIQKKEDIETYLNSAWTFLILRGLFLYIILYLLAPYIAIFFNTPKAGSIIQAIGVLLIFKAFNNIGIIYFKKELEFYKEFIYQFSGTIVDFIVAVVAVLTLKNVWALVLGQLAGSFVKLILSYFVHPYRPRINFSPEKVKELFVFGKWILSSNILAFLLTHGDDIFVGKYLGASSLGFYQMAYRISNMPATEITHVISQVTFPAYSKLQNNLPKLRAAYLKVLQLTAFLSFPLAGLIFIIAPDFIKIFLGDKWLPMLPAMQILSIYGVIRSINSTVGTFFLGIGRPEILPKITIYQIMFIAIIIFPLTKMKGVFGTSIAITIPYIAVMIYLFSKTLLKNNIGFRVSHLLKALYVSFFACIGMILLFIILRKLIIHMDVVTMILLISLIIIFYVGIALIFDYFLNNSDLRKNITKYFNFT